VKGTQGCAAGTWCTLKIEYAAGVAKVHLNGVLSASLTVKLAFGGAASLNVSSTNFSNGNVFMGNLRNLHVYSAGLKIAQYPLTADGKDVLGKKGAFTLRNAPFQSPGPGVSLAGVYPMSSTVGNDVTTGNLAAMNMSDFRITGEFTISALPAGTMPVIIGGTSFRWLGAMIEPAGTLTLMYANTSMKTTTRAVSLNAKHTVSIRYSAASTIAAIYLDGVLAGTQAIAGGLPAGSDKNVSSTYYCCGTAFKGSLHRIRVDSK
jgi:hypothetical protein